MTCLTPSWLYVIVGFRLRFFVWFVVCMLILIFGYSSSSILITWLYQSKCFFLQLFQYAAAFGMQYNVGTWSAPLRKSISTVSVLLLFSFLRKKSPVMCKLLERVFPSSCSPASWSFPALKCISNNSNHFVFSCTLDMQTFRVSVVFVYSFGSSPNHGLESVPR